MTPDERQTIRQFEAKIRNLIAKFIVLQKENSDLYTELEKKEEEISLLKHDKDKLQSDYDNLRLAKMIEISDADFKDAKKRITALVREVNKCINMLSANNTQEV